MVTELKIRGIRTFILDTVIITLLLLVSTGLVSNPLQALGADRPEGPPRKPIPARAANPKLATKLQVLEQEWQKNRISGQAYAQSINMDVQNEMVTVIIEPDGPSSKAINQQALAGLGGEVEATSRSLMRARIPVNALSVLAGSVDGISFIRTPLPRKAVKVDTTEGLVKTDADQYHDAGYYGQGARVAIIDLGFDYLTEVQDSGDVLSSSIVYTKDYTGTGLEEGIQHGTNVAEIVYDMAPQADLYLMKISDSTDLENAVDDAISNGVDIINHSIAWYNANYYDGTGPEDWGVTGTNVAQIAANARDNEILWVNSAGNEALSHWQGDWYDSDGDEWLNFSDSNNQNYIGYVAEGSVIEVYMTWDAWPSDPEDYDVCLDRYADGSWDYVVTCSSDVQNGSQPPTEAIYYLMPQGEAGDYYFSITNVLGSGNPEIDLFAYVDQSSGISGQLVSSSSIVTPANDDKVLAVGAIDESDWTKGPQSYYSSLGPSNDSQYASSRIKPDMMGPTCVSTSGYGVFCGTSSSAPHLAGAAALLLSENSSRTADDLQSILESNAIDMGDSGDDNTYGLGRLEIPAPDTGSETDAVFRVDNQGNVYSDSAYYGENFQSGGADLAEKVWVTESVEPGDVLAMDPDNPKQYRKSQKSYSTLAVGVVSTRPGMTLSEEDDDANATMALLGTVPVKATTENGPIGLGDLLTTSSKPGYAMVCNDTSRCTGSLIGKALESLEEGEGKIRMLIMS